VSGLHELLARRYKRLWLPPWKPGDYVAWQFGALPPKDYGEVLFSDEFNYVLLTLYLTRASKRLIFKGHGGPAASFGLLRTSHRTAYGDVILVALRAESSAGFIERPLLAVLTAAGARSPAATSALARWTPAGAVAPAKVLSLLSTESYVEVRE